MKAGFRLHEAGVGSSDGANRGTSAERRSDQRSRDSGRADDHGSGGTDRHRAGRYRSAKSAAATAAGAAGGLLCHGSGPVCAGFLRRGPALPIRGRALVALGWHGCGVGRQVGHHQGPGPARDSAAARAVRARVARPLATVETQGAWYRGRRLVSLDGTTIDLPDSPALEERFGRPGAARGASSFPQLRLLTLTETGTHAIFAIAFDRCAVGEARLAPDLLHQLQPGMLCLADRAFVGFELWRTATASGGDLLWRMRKNQILPCSERRPDGSYMSRLYASPKDRRHDTGGVTVRVIDYRLEGVPDAEPLYRLITTLLDPADAPAAELAALYHERWESEGAFAELKVSLPGQRLMLRSRRADLAEQELYGLLLAHFALRRLIHDASRHAGCDPDTLSFVHTVRIVRRHLPFHAAFSPSPAPPHG